MDRTNTSRLRGILSNAEGPCDRAFDRGRCGLCDRRLSAGAAVEVELDADAGADPDAWLCADCYEFVVAELGVAPTRVFKTGTLRTVVLPVPEAETGPERVE
jgi:hypothetical protein